MRHIRCRPVSDKARHPESRGIRAERSPGVQMRSPGVQTRSRGVQMRSPALHHTIRARYSRARQNSLARLPNWPVAPHDRCSSQADAAHTASRSAGLPHRLSRSTATSGDIAALATDHGWPRHMIPRSASRHRARPVHGRQNSQTGSRPLIRRGALNDCIVCGTRGGIACVTTLRLNASFGGATFLPASCPPSTAARVGVALTPAIIGACMSAERGTVTPTRLIASLRAKADCGAAVTAPLMLRLA